MQMRFASSSWNTIYLFLLKDKHPLKWRHKKSNGVPNHQKLDGIFNNLFEQTSKKTSKSALQVTGGFPSQRAGNAESVSMAWRYTNVSQYSQYHDCW